MKKIFTLLMIATTIAFLGCTEEETKVDGRLLGLDIKFKHTSPRTGEVLTNVYEDAYREGDQVLINIESSYEIDRIEVVNGTTKVALNTIDVNGTTASFTYPAADLEIPFGQRAALKFHFYFNDAGTDGFDFPSMKSITFNANSDIPSIASYKKTDGSVTELKTTDKNIVGFAEDEVRGVYATTIPDEISYLEIENTPLLNFGVGRNFSISFWIQSDHDESDPAIMGTQDWNSSSNKGWVIAWLNGRIRAVACDGEGNKTDLRTAPEQSILGADWHFVTVIFNRTADAQIWIDGQLAVSTAMVNGNIDTGLPVKINQDGTGTYSPRLGAKYSNIVFYDYALSESQISQIYNSK